MANAKHKVIIGVDRANTESSDRNREPIRMTVESWLNVMCPLGRGDNPVHHLDIIESKPAWGVKGVMIRTAAGDPDRNGLELRVRFPLDAEQWVCILYCSSSDILVDLFEADRTNALDFIIGKLRHDRELEVHRALAFGKGRRRIDMVFERQDQTVEKLRNDRKFAKLAFYLNSYLKDGPIDPDQVYEAVKCTLGDNTKRVVMPHVLHFLVDEAVLEPLIDTKKSEVRFARGLYMDDLLELHKDTLNQAEQSRREQALTPLRKKLTIEQGKKQQIEVQLRKANEKITDLENKILQLGGD